MPHAYALFVRLVLGAATLTALAYLGLALRDSRPQLLARGRLMPALGAGAVLGLVPLAALGGPSVFLAGLCLGAALGLGLLALDLFGRYREALREARATVGRALAALEQEQEALLVSVRARLEGDPAVPAPVTSRPCLRFRLEVSRLDGQGGDELVFLDEGRAERLVLRDEQGQVALAWSGRPPRERFEQTVLEGEVTAEELLESPAPRRPIARLARKYDPDLPTEGVRRYRLVERVLVDGLSARVDGRLERQGGEPVLGPYAVSLEPPARPRRLGRLAARHASAALGSLLAGWMWLVG